ncbi:MAG: Rne/Rng family ribonuclease [Deltaproteobacteria bacterium]|nr:MAG: Rne/Rng family ribonuclease [Deltaproteobacteria bacterium]
MRESRYILINSRPYETRVAVVESGTLTEFSVERAEERNIVGNIYKGRVIRVLPGMQAAFVDIGLERAAFLYAGDFQVNVAERELFEEEDDIYQSLSRRAELAELDRSSFSLASPPIEGLVRESQQILVQVTKEPLGTKGPRISGNISLPGRYLVLLTFTDHIGISRKIENPEERERLRKIVEKIRPPGLGFIVRTASEGKTEKDLLHDAEYLLRLWEDIRRKGEEKSAPALLHSELSLPYRVLRDLAIPETDRIFVDQEDIFEELRAFSRQFLPALHDSLELYRNPQPIFEFFGVELEISRALEKKVWLKSGGYIVIEQTEALTAIDVNTGKYVGRENLEETSLKINLEAVREIVYQLKLRNIGGIIIIDFIDMMVPENREKVYEALADALKTDRAKTVICQISELGLIEMTRKRVRESLRRSISEECPYCGGEGIVRSKRTIVYSIFRALEKEARMKKIRKVVLSVHPDIAEEIMGEERKYLELLERQFGITVEISPTATFHLEEFLVEPI